MVSSTAVTSSMAEKSTHDVAHLYPTVIATITACTIMLFRVIIIVVAFNPYLLGTLLIPISSMILMSVIMLVWLWKKSKSHEVITVSSKYESPFQIIPALKFAGLIVLIKFFSTLAVSYQDVFSQISWLENLKNFPIYLISLLSGLADVDAITQDMAEKSALGAQSLTSLAATVAIIIALVTNTTIKIGLAKKF